MIHYSFIGYIIAVAIILLSCTIAYKLFLEDKVEPVLNRRILLTVYAVAVILPFFVALIPESNIDNEVNLGMLEFTDMENTEVNLLSNQGSFDFSSLTPLSVHFYYAGVLIMFLFTCTMVGRLFFLVRNSMKTYVRGVEVYVHNIKKLSSFSWFNKIFIFSEFLEKSSEELEILLSHELCHLQRFHWIDLAIAQTVLIFQWFNPAAWYLRKELQRIHEYEADASVLDSGINETKYQMLLIKNISRNQFSGLTDGLNNCSLKKRIIMMQKKSFQSNGVIRGLAMAAFAVAGGVIIHIPAVASTLTLPSNPPGEKVPVTLIMEMPENINGDTVKIDYKEIENFMNNENSGELSVSDSNIKIKKVYRSPIQMNQKSGSESSTDKEESKTENARVNYTLEEVMAKKGNSDIVILDSPNVEKGMNKTVVTPEKVAQYQRGEMQLMYDLGKLVLYPEEASKAKIQGKVVVGFQVNTDGTISDIKIVKSVDPILDEAAIKAVESLPGKWIPAEDGGKAVASVYNLPINFRLSPES